MEQKFRVIESERVKLGHGGGCYMLIWSRM